MLRVQSTLSLVSDRQMGSGSWFSCCYVAVRQILLIRISNMSFKDFDHLKLVKFELLQSRCISGNRLSYHASDHLHKDYAVR